MESDEDENIGCNELEDARCYKRLITVIFREKIERHLKPTDRAVLLMLKDDLITIDDMDQVNHKCDSSGSTAAIHVLLEIIGASEEEHIYRKFVDALANSKDETCKILAEDIQGLLSPERDENEAIFHKLIQNYSLELTNIAIADIIPHLGNLSSQDREQIEACEDMRGRSAGATKLMHLLSRCLGETWFVDLMVALRRGKYDELADKFVEGYHQCKKADPSKSMMSIAKSSSPDDPEEKGSKDIEMEDVQSHQDGYTSGDEADHNEGAAPVQEETDDMVMNLNSLDADEKDGLKSPFDQAGASPERIELRKQARNVSEENQEEEGTEKLPSSGASTSAENKPSNLYEDQLEVALPAIEGRNTLIQMPTGAGKTVVAAKIIEKVINDADKPLKCKVIFMVPTGPLVKQQQERLEERLRPTRNFRITGLKGDTQKVPLKETLEVHNVVVLTAAILDNALREGDHLVELDTLALFVFDECHHCMKDHVYNSIMKRYMFEMFEYPDTCKLPQIIALTATTGTGKAKSQVAAEDHVFQLICNLNTAKISVVELHKNKLKERMNVPEEMNPICVDPRAEDPFKTEVCKIMSDIEDIMKQSEAGALLKELKAIPRDRKTQGYMQWLSRLEKESGKEVGDGDQLRIIRTCVRHLHDYHVSLLINAEVRTKDAYDYLNSKYNEMSEPDQMEAFNDTDFNLLRKFMSKRRTFGEVSKNPKYHNPLLKTLEEIIVREYKQRPKSRALLFCQSVETTKALKTWIEETASLQFLQPNRMVGGKGMTSAQHKEILDKFQDGRHKLLVATNVLEEGIDVAECNLVIRLNYVPSDTGHVQSKGRGRAKDSKCYLIASSECNHAAWELANQARSEMSQRAVDGLRRMPIEELETRMLARQREDYFQYKMEKQAAQSVRPIHAGEFQLLCGGCRSFACSTIDIGVYNESHHIVLDERFLVERTKVSPHPKPKRIDHEFSKIGKIHCKECNKDWGILAIICQQTLPIIKIVSFIIEREDENGKKLRYLKEKWIDAKKIFRVNPLKREDLQGLKKMNVPEY